MDVRQEATVPGMDAGADDGHGEAGPEVSLLPLAIPVFFPETVAVDGEVAVQFGATGGVPPYSGWSVILGELPEGTELNGATGMLSGGPEIEGVFSFVVQVRDSAGARAQELFGIRIGDPAGGWLALLSVADRG